MEEPKKKKASKKKKTGDEGGEEEVKFEEPGFSTDPMDMLKFGEEGLDRTEGESKKVLNFVHLHYQQRSARKCLTIVQGLPADLDFKKIARAFKKLFSCNGTVVEDKDKGTVIQLQGDKRRDVADFLLHEGIATEEEIKIHGH